VLDGILRRPRPPPPPPDTPPLSATTQPSTANQTHTNCHHHRVCHTFFSLRRHTTQPTLNQPLAAISPLVQRQQPNKHRHDAQPCNHSPQSARMYQYNNNHISNHRQHSALQQHTRQIYRHDSAHLPFCRLRRHLQPQQYRIFVTLRSLPSQPTVAWPPPPPSRRASLSLWSRKGMRRHPPDSTLHIHTTDRT